MNTRQLLLLTAIASSTLTSGCTGKDGNPKELRCNREDVLTAAIESIRRTASGYTYSDYIYPPSKLDNKPLAAYSDQLGSTPITLEQVETVAASDSRDGTRQRTLRCRALLKIEIPAQVSDVMKRNQYQKMRVLDNGKGRFGDSSVYFEEFSFNAREIDGGSIKVHQSDFNGPWSLHIITTLAVNGRHLILQDALKRYHARDGELNKLWRILPKDLQATGLATQRDWITSKTDQCGTINLESDDTEDTLDRVDVIDCHIKMTETRIFEIRR